MINRFKLTVFPILLINLLTATVSVHADNRDVVFPKTQDALLREPLRSGELGGELDRRIRDLIFQNYMVVNLDRDWLDHFRNRTSRNGKRNIYYGIGKVIDAGSLFAQYTGDIAVSARTNYLIDELRKTRDSDGYLGFWKVEPNNEQNNINWILHEQEYINLALVRNYRTTGNPASLADAKIMADYIMRSFPANDQGINYIKPGISIAGITEGFIELYRVTGDEKYMKFAQNLQYEPHWYYEPWPDWSKNIDQRRFHLYVMMSHMYPETELYRLTGDSARLLKSRWLQKALLEQEHGALLVTGSSSEGEHFTYNQKGSGDVEESCVTAYLLRLFDSLMRIDGDMRLGDVMERTIYNALFAAQSPDGRHICYFTPFTGKRSFQTRDTFCCNGNFRRGVAEIPAKVYYRTPDGGIVLNLYTKSDKVFDVHGKSVRIQEETDYPNSGDVKLTFDMKESVRFAFRFRTPRWCETMTVQVNQEKPLEIIPSRQSSGYYELVRDWKKQDTIRITMPMEWRFVRGRVTQKDHVALLRGPLLFCIGEAQNRGLIKKVSQVRDLVLDPESLGQPEQDDTVRPGGLKVRAKAWLTANRTGSPVDVVLNEFTDPSGLDVYFRIPDKTATPVRMMDDELLFEPRTTPLFEIISAFLGQELSDEGEIQKLFDQAGPIITDPVKSYIAPNGRLDRAAEFPDGHAGTWSFLRIKDRTLSMSTKGNVELLHSRNQVYATPPGFAYGQDARDGLGFIAPHTPSDRQGPLWKEHFTEKVMDQEIPEKERNDYFYLHPVGNPQSDLVLRWTPGPQEFGKKVALDLTVLSRAEGNGVGLSCYSVGKNGSRTLLHKMLSSNGLKGMSSGLALVTRRSVLATIPSGGSLDFVIDNNGQHNSDTTALKIRIRTAVLPKGQEDVTEILQAVTSETVETNLAPFADRFGKKSQEKGQTLKIKLLDRLTGEIQYRQMPLTGTLIR